MRPSAVTEGTGLFTKKQISEIPLTWPPSPWACVQHVREFPLNLTKGRRTKTPVSPEGRACKNWEFPHRQTITHMKEEPTGAQCSGCSVSAVCTPTTWAREDTPVHSSHQHTGCHVTQIGALPEDTQSQTDVSPSLLSTVVRAK